MKNSKENAALQVLSLAWVLLAGTYGLSGSIPGPDSDTYVFCWLSAAAAAALFWTAAVCNWRKDFSEITNKPVASALMGLYFFIAAAAFLRGLLSLWKQWALADTPLLLLAAVASSVAVYGAQRGVRPVLRLCLPVALVAVISFIIDTALLVPEMSLERLHLEYKCFDAPLFFKLLGSMLLPLPASLLLINNDVKLTFPYHIAGALLGILYLAASAIRSVLLLGPLTVLEPFPLLDSLTLVYMGPALSRMDAWGLMALSAAMIASAMGLAAGGLLCLPPKWQGKTGSFIVAVVLTALVFF